MANKYYINYMDYYIPTDQMESEYIIRNTSVEKKSQIKNLDKCISKFKDETHIEKVSYFKDSRAFSRKVYELVERMLKTTQIDPENISYILCGNQHLFHMDGVSIVQSLKYDFKFSNSMILPIMQPCAAALCGLNIANKLLEDDKYILILSGCCWKNIEERYIDFSIRGDGISLVLLSRNKGPFRIIKSNVLNFNNAAFNVDGTLKHDPSLSRFNLINKGSEFLLESLKVFDIEIDDIAKIIQPNTGYYVFHELYSYYTKIRPEMFFYDNIPNGGHICDVDIVRNLMDYDQRESLDIGSQVMLYTPDVEPTFDINYHSVLLEKC